MAPRLPKTAASDTHPSVSSPLTREPLAASQFPFTFKYPPPSARTSDAKVVVDAQAASSVESQPIEIENKPFAKPEVTAAPDSMPPPPKRRGRGRRASDQKAFEDWLLKYPEDKTPDDKFRVLRNERRWIKAFLFDEHQIQCRKCNRRIQLTRGDDGFWSIAPWIDHRKHDCTGIFKAFTNAQKSGQLWNSGSEW